MPEKLKIINKTFLKLDDFVININHICSVYSLSDSSGNRSCLSMVCDGHENGGHFVSVKMSDIMVALVEMGEL